MDDGPAARARRGARSTQPKAPQPPAPEFFTVPPPQVQNDVLRQLVADMEAERSPNVTVASTAGFEGKVWE